MFGTNTQFLYKGEIFWYMRRADYTWYRQGRPWNSIQYTNTSKHKRLIIGNMTINIVLPSRINLQMIFQIKIILYRILYVVIFFMSRKRDAKNETTKILIRNKEIHRLTFCKSISIIIGNKKFCMRIMLRHQRRWKNNSLTAGILFCRSAFTSKETECCMNFCYSVTSMQHALHISLRRIMSCI